MQIKFKCKGELRLEGIWKESLTSLTTVQGRPTIGHKLKWLKAVSEAEEADVLIYSTHLWKESAT